MVGPGFEWDLAKAAANLAHHGVSFEQAATVFEDPLAKIHDDPEHSSSERRAIIAAIRWKAGSWWCLSPIAGVTFGLSAQGLRPGWSAATMRKRSSAVSDGLDDLKPEYRFDYSKARPNSYAARLRGKAVAVVLDSEVAAAFPTSESVNSALRAVLVQRRSKGKRVARRRSNNQLQRTRPAQAKKPRR